jgi:hypothetical protein
MPINKFILIEPLVTDLSKESSREVEVTDFIASPGGSRLIMPDEETSIKLGDAPRSVAFISSGGGDSSSKEPKNLHERTAQTFARVFVNSVGQSEAEKENPQFAPGSIIVREKLQFGTDATAQLVTVMIKREKGFSSKSGDWEFFVLGGKDLKLQKRETKGDCAKCHIQAQKTDWVFRSYLK